MISFVTCSINDIQFSLFEKSLKATVGTDYEIIKIENSISNYSLSTAYNMGAEKAKFPFLCFVHEDVVFKNDKWGSKLISFFEKNPQAGLVGIAGSTVKTLTPSIWANGLYDTDYYNLIQYYKKDHVSAHLRFKEGPENYKEVKTLDGVFLFTRKDVLKQHQFDEKLSKFHCYDLDLCFQIGQKFKIYVSYDVLLEHYSTGSLSKDWAEASIRLTEKWKHILPLGDIDRKKLIDIEWKNKKVFFFRMNILKYPLSSILSQFIKWGYFKNFSISKHFNFLKELISLKLKHKAR
ncbi:Glycosyltransferase like family protein [Pedobacter terrae]|uniref:Glycosyltransferase like family protein n=1 Tax=Pedobacter terrae TaxID=405671 RepID=A0A1G7U499_9SPHI|nr:glycosyltransferase [Pedobacter terrae]SDG42091.1 Glycosyltransferase like family protein [Pedobacter terrae]